MRFQYRYTITILLMMCLFFACMIYSARNKGGIILVHMRSLEGTPASLAVAGAVETLETAHVFNDETHFLKPDGDTKSEDYDIMKNIILEEFFSVVDNRSDNIFQIWPLEPMYLYRALCSVESWSLNHPNSSVWFIFTVKELQDSDGLLHKLIAKYSNLRFIYIDLKKAFVGTAFYDIGLTSAWNKSRWPGVHLSDFLRQALVWQKGGYYADTDVFPVRSLDGLRNFILSDKERLDASLMHFDAHHPFLTVNMETGAANYNIKKYSGLSITSSTKAARSACNISTDPLLPDGDLPYRECKLGGNSSFRLLSFQYCPQCCRNCLKPKSGLHIDEFVKSGAYAFHLCNGATRKDPQSFVSANLLNAMAERNCPFIYKQAQGHSNFW